jgi:hypothetical protein
MASYVTLFAACRLAALGLGSPFGHTDLAWAPAPAGGAALPPVTIAGLGVRARIIVGCLHARRL